MESLRRLNDVHSGGREGIAISEDEQKKMLVNDSVTIFFFMRQLCHVKCYFKPAPMLYEYAVRAMLRISHFRDIDLE